MLRGAFESFPSQASRFDCTTRLRGLRRVMLRMPLAKPRRDSTLTLAIPNLARLRIPSYGSDMTPKQKTLQAIGTLPEDVSYEQLQEEVRILAALDEGEAEIREGRVVSQEEVKRRLAQWTSS